MERDEVDVVLPNGRLLTFPDELMHLMPPDYISRSVGGQSHVRVVVRARNAPRKALVVATGPGSAGSTRAGVPAGLVAQQIAAYEAMANTPWHMRSAIDPTASMVIPHATAEIQSAAVSAQLNREAIDLILSIGTVIIGHDQRAPGHLVLHRQDASRGPPTASQLTAPLIALYLLMISSCLRPTNRRAILVTIGRPHSQMADASMESVREFVNIFGAAPQARKLQESTRLPPGRSVLRSMTLLVPTLGTRFAGGADLVDILWASRWNNGRVAFAGEFLAPPHLAKPGALHVHIGDIPYGGPLLARHSSPDFFIQV
jgi:hypothetical protein